MEAVHAASLVLLLAIVAFAGGDAHEAFDKAFRQFLHDNGYRGGAVGVLKNGRLVLAKGYGVTRDGTEVKTGARFPVSSISKSITAVAVLRLVQDGLMDLDDTVFGSQGILHALSPLNKEWADPRVRDITVAHLLRHSGGWDQNKGPMFDPVLNEMYQSRGQHVPNIAKVMDAPTPLDPATIIRFAISQSLDFAPGSRTVYSNLGYLVLGRVVEEVSGLPYEDYVKRFILNPCGMWHTRLGDPYTARRGHKLDDDVPEEETPETERKHPKGELPLFDLLDPRAVDSTLGWYSTVYDVARFARCVFDGERVLTDDSLEVLLQRPETDAVGPTGDTWFCSGFQASTRNVVWQEGDPHTDDIILFHNLKPNGQQHQQQQLPDTWVVFLHGSKLHRLRQKTRILMHELAEWMATLPRNFFARDLSDVDAASVADDVLVKFRVDEHHLDAYISAIKQEGYDLRWVSPYSHQHHTSFLVLSRRVDSLAQAASDFTLEHGLSEDQLLSRKLHMEGIGYNITFLQSYHSQSHQLGDCFMAVFRRHAFTSQAQLKYGTDHLPEPYDKLVQMYHEENFRPLVQSVLPHKGEEEEHFSFIFIQVPGEKPMDFKNYYRLPEARLESTIVLNSRHGRTLTFLDAYELEGKARFAAVFTNETKARWLFRGGLLQEQAALLIQAKLPSDLWPQVIVAYADKESSELKFAVFLLSQREDGQTGRMESSLIDHLLPEEETTGSVRRVVIDGSNI